MCVCVCVGVCVCACMCADLVRHRVLATISLHSHEDKTHITITLQKTHYNIQPYKRHTTIDNPTKYTLQ